ncbi:hypothetical protein JI735_18165 [Paenibacillus sonchi]|uniref:Uncharacterized protein n=1 Tax=Paenibacillus sonchi TaxID=373687 RepID=A0A974P7T9_9BACL|nr:hypothetical protein [Paenibacillus sonchi]QQZ58696.1 hypothetical protein JI735_18165 [Paenibacillus sonchi]
MEVKIDRPGQGIGLFVSVIPLKLNALRSGSIARRGRVTSTTPLATIYSILLKI